MASYAQKNVTQFLGIPVDGTKYEMIQKLKEKGFRNVLEDREILEGEFNGCDVYVFVVTNNNRVYRIMVADRYNVDEADIKIRFNNLCHQFENNPKYDAKKDDQTIPEDEDISYEMSEHKKIYQASYYQNINRKTDDSSEKDLSEVISELIGYVNRTVWFQIARRGRDRYYICMYYDNGYNEANGEDL